MELINDMPSSVHQDDRLCDWRTDWKNFDVRQTQCHDERDREALLLIIEAAFLDNDKFNSCAQSLSELEVQTGGYASQSVEEIMQDHSIGDTVVRQADVHM